MAFASETLFTSDKSGQLWNACVWNPDTGSTLTTFKGSVSSKGTLTVLGKSWLVSGNPDKPLLNVWQIDRHEQRPVKQTLPGVAGALAATKCGKIVALSVQDRIYVWMATSGRLVNVITSGGHYQAVTGLSFTGDASHLISVGADGRILAWTTSSLVGSSGSPPKPRLEWSDHSLDISGHVVGAARVYTCSRDQTAKIHDVRSGHLLLDVTFAVPLTAIAVDAAESTVYVGANNGNVHMFSLRSPPRDLNMSVTPDKSNTFNGHQKAVTCLSVSVAGHVLASGSDDGDVRLWDVKSGLTLRTLSHKGALTNVQFMLPVPGLLGESTFKPTETLAPFEKTPNDNNSYVDIIIKDEVPGYVNDDDDFFVVEHEERQGQQSTIENGTSSHENPEVAKLKDINLQLYQHALQKIIQS